MSDLTKTREAIRRKPDDEEVVIDDLFIPNVNDNPSTVTIGDLKALEARLTNLEEAAFNALIHAQGLRDHPACGVREDCVICSLQDALMWADKKNIAIPTKLT